MGFGLSLGLLSAWPETWRPIIAPWEPTCSNRNTPKWLRGTEDGVKGIEDGAVESRQRSTCGGGGGGR